eukprot:1583199-Pleurochrysis_carterae.AAC.2
MLRWALSNMNMANASCKLRTDSSDGQRKSQALTPDIEEAQMVRLVRVWTQPKKKVRDGAVGGTF